jgi:photosystem II stability/assembly factor-like uncharacterized protein
VTILYLATADGISIVHRGGESWSGSTQLQRIGVECVLIDPRDTRIAYCGTSGSGLYQTTDAGMNWQPNDQLATRHVSALAMNAAGVLFAGTEPSEVLRSANGGQTWAALPALTTLASAREWSFPPRPHTHHVKAIVPDSLHAGDLHVAVEAGALVHSSGGGIHWRDRVAGAPRDTHWLVADPTDPRRLSSAAGDGFFESTDDGETWRRFEEGLEDTYCWSLAIPSGSNRVQVMSAAKGAYGAHYERMANASVYRREGESPWEKVHHGLPGPGHHRAAVIAKSTSEPGVLYLSTEGLVFRSTDEGRSWSELPVNWPGHPPGHAVDMAAA